MSTEAVNHPAHYGGDTIYETIKVLEAWLTPEQFIELARMVLPLNTYSHMFWKTDLRNLFHFLTLRCDPHAQYEIRVYAEAMREIARAVAPIAVSAWEANP